MALMIKISCIQGKKRDLSIALSMRDCLGPKKGNKHFS